MYKLSKCVRFYAIILVAAILVSTCPLSMQAFADNTLFFDDFHSNTLIKWGKQNSKDVQDGKYVLNGDSSNYVTGLGTLKNVSVSADVSVSVNKKDNGFNAGQTAYVCARSNKSGTFGYEFGIGITKSGITFARLFRRNTKGESQVLYQQSTTLDNFGKIESGKTYNISLTAAGESLFCFVNGVKVVSVKDKSFSDGYVGIKQMTFNGSFDNFKVTSVPEKKAKEIKLDSHSQKVSRSGKICFTGKVIYNDFYDAETFNQDTSGVKITGLDGKAGKKTVKVTYCGKSATFPITVTEKYTSRTVYYSDFSSKTLTGWKAGSYTLKDNGKEIKTFSYYQNNGNLFFDATDTKGYDEGVSCNIYRPAAELNGEECYSVSAKCAVMKNAVTATKRSGAVAVLFAKNAGDSQYYEFRLASSGALTVYRSGTALVSNNVKNVLGKDFSMGTYYTLQVDVFENCAEMYLNGKFVFTLADFGDDNTVPYAGLRAVSGIEKFDDFSVKTLECKGVHGVTGLTLTDIKHKESVGSGVLHSFDNKFYVLRVTYSDGTYVPYRISNKMLSQYNPTSPKLQNITIRYGDKSLTFKYQYFLYLFYDDFDTVLNSKWVFTNSLPCNYGITAGRLKLTYNSVQPAKGSVTAKVGDGYDWKNYSVSADVYLDPTGNVNGLTRYFGIDGRTVKNSRYEFRLTINSAGVISGKLYRFNNSVSTLLTSVPESKLKLTIDNGKTFGTGNTYNMRMDMLDNTIRLYFNNKQIATYVDESSDALTAGTAGITCISSNIIFDNFIVKPVNYVSVTKMELSSSKDGKYYVWQGNDIDVWNNDLIVTYSDGSKETVALKAKMIGDFDNEQLGAHKVTLKYDGFEYATTVIVRDRKDYVDKFVNQLSDFDSSVSSNNASAFLKLKQYYDTLTPYEVEHLDKKWVEKYSKLDDSYDIYVTPELKGVNRLVNNQFLGDSVHKWNSSVDLNYGKWFERNGVYYQAQIPYGKSSTGWSCPAEFGKIAGISADCLMLSYDMHIGVGINIGEDGYYHARITSTAHDENDNSIYQLQLLRADASGHKKLEVLNTETYNHHIDRQQWFNIRLTIVDKTVNVYLNGECLISYEESFKLFDKGQAGLRISEGDGLYDNVKVWGTEIKQAESAAKIEPYIYKDNFDDEKANSNPSHWVEESLDSVKSVTDNWKVYNRNGNNVYGTKSTGTTYTYLHAFDNNPTVNVTLTAEKFASDSRFGFIIRNAPTYAYTRVLYDCGASKWVAISQNALVDGEKAVFSDKTFDFKPNKSYKIELEANDVKLTLKVDGKKVLETDQLTHIGYGRIGFYTEKTSLYIDDFKAVISSGDVPQDGVLEYTINYEDGMGHFEIETFDNGKHLLGVNVNYLYESLDNGTTWNNVTDDPRFNDVSQTQYVSLLKLRNGKTLQVRVSDFMIQESTDLMHWKDCGYVLSPEDIRTPSGLRCALTHVNSLTEVKLKNGSYRLILPVGFRKYSETNSVLGHYTAVYYSDDNGYTWKRSETTTKEILPGYTDDNKMTWSESKVIACSDGTLRMYYSRNSLGCMEYTESKDGGVTWSGLYQIPEIQLGKTSFALFEDSYNEGTFYMICLNGKARSLGSMFPRTRTMLLRSTDGKNWEFLTNLERMNSYESTLNSVELYQMIDPSLFTDEKYVYCTFGRSEFEYSEDDANAHQAQRMRYLRIEKSKLSARPWDATNIADMSYPKTIKFKKNPQMKFGQGDLFSRNGTIALTDFNGNVTEEAIDENCICYSEPNMFKLGKQLIKLNYKNGYDLSYEIQIVPNHKLTWDIYGEGNVKPEDKKIMEGIDKEYELIPDKGWKISKAYLEDQKLQIKNGKITLSDIKKNVVLSVYFAKKTVLDYWWFWLLIGMVVCGSGAGVFILLKKKKSKITGVIK